MGEGIGGRTKGRCGGSVGRRGRCGRGREERERRNGSVWIVECSDSSCECVFDDEGWDVEVWGDGSGVD